MLGCETDAASQGRNLPSEPTFMSPSSARLVNCGAPLWVVSSVATGGEIPTVNRVIVCDVGGCEGVAPEHPTAKSNTAVAVKANGSLMGFAPSLKACGLL